ncbi:MAG: YbbR-like domain-containing protein [Deltaproteobacteria bacterium]|nr:YbbR-like domain-containing protein [Deltaproteobacteria bacterium]
MFKNGLSSKWISGNLVLKLLSLALGVLLWLLVSGQHKMELGLIGSLRFDNMPSSLMMVNEPVDSLDVRVMGPRTVLFNLVEDRLIYPLDLTGVQAGQTSFVIEPDRFILPMGVHITRVNPSNIAVVLDNVVLKEVPIRVELVGTPPEGYQLGSVESIPPTVVLRGAKNAISPIDRISTEPISIMDSPGILQREVELSIPRIPLQSVTPRTVKATIEIIPVEAQHEP